MDVVYEGQSRRFAVQSVSTAEASLDDDLVALEFNLDQLSLGSKPKLWTVGWDTVVTIIDNSDKPPPKESVSFCGVRAYFFSDPQLDKDSLHRIQLAT